MKKTIQNNIFWHERNFSRDPEESSEQALSNYLIYLLPKEPNLKKNHNGKPLHDRERLVRQSLKNISRASLDVSGCSWAFRESLGIFGDLWGPLGVFGGLLYPTWDFFGFLILLETFRFSYPTWDFRFSYLTWDLLS